METEKILKKLTDKLTHELSIIVTDRESLLDESQTKQLIDFICEFVAMPSLPMWVQILDSFGLTIFSEQIFQKKYRQDLNRLKTLPPQVQEVAEQVLRKVFGEFPIHQNAIE